ncbi:copper homeostasis protein CutC [Crassaminicella profunda]|uniref:copper homeostasis protein CutC n=1 Tax=Crassaminicella profunda TaxID=1286698 RepID=UPI001CA6112C|nr:copper homeostasis protein CutC [Crassaminicella profunda]QZY55808.1 copper homeostasis protein CutC [Crassaminicella profunda]
MYMREACVGSFEEAKKAQELGANRIELCDNLKEGGTTPSYGTILMAKKFLDIPIMVIIRPKGGNFIYSKAEIEIMKIDIKICKELGVMGVVFGILDEHNLINKEVTKELVDLAKPLHVTFHMAFDEIEDKKRALEELVELKVDTILTKGCKTKAFDGKETIKELIHLSKDRIIILPGGGITKENYLELMQYTNAKEVHGTKIVGRLK